MVAFCLGKSAVLMVEEGAPDYLEQALNTVLRRRDIQTRVAGKDVLPMGGEYTAPVVVTGVRAFLLAHAPELLRNQPPMPDPAPILAHEKVKALAKTVPPRPPGFCIGCPERPIFAAMKLVEKELGRITSRPTSAAICSRSCRPSTSARRRWAMAWGPPPPRRSM